ncbi:Phospholipase A(1) DAD1 chloroplastic [Bienertia sinuspersici]
MKSYNLPSIDVPTQQHCNIATLTQQLTFQAQQSIHHHSLRDFESMSPSSAARVSDRWEEFMGLKDWAGLLDPLDENLSHEILRYGNFIEAAYRAFDFDPESPSYGSCKYKKRSLLQNCGLPNSGYRISRHLRATSGIPVPEWARSSWAAAQSGWIGYVAVSDNKAVIDRLGRREVVIALRGTATCLEWLENLRATLTPVSGPTNLNNANVGPWDRDGPPMVESGFLSLYTSSTDMWPSLQEAIRKEVSQILEEYKNEPLSITITGHSLGAALAKIAAYDIKTTFEKAPLVTVISFGGPRVGNQSFRSLVDRQGTKILRVVNPSDLITKVPGFVSDNGNEEFVNKNTKTSKKHSKISHKNYYSYNNNSNNNNNNNSNSKLHPLAEFIPNWITQPFSGMEDKQWWVYAEVGRELRLENKETEQLPYYLSNMNVAKCHDLKTYLNLVENCPIKAFVKRSLNKLSHRCKHKNDDTSILAA